jgi:hypothetical protein
VGKTIRAYIAFLLVLSSSLAMPDEFSTLI